MSDDLRCECGIFGIFGANNAADLTYFGLYALQHRGQEQLALSVSMAIPAMKFAVKGKLIKYSVNAISYRN